MWARSQLAAALLRRVVAPSVRTHSAGTLPSQRIDPTARRLLDEIGLTPGHRVSQAADPRDGPWRRHRDHPRLRRRLPRPARPPLYEWNLPDLKGLDIESARSVRDALTARVERLAAELSAGQAP
ncbi:hypothetical protein OHA98_20425 [Streptomyces sp. NBC_00654]|nr:hypothetical protein [Streptomyces sp. NBC_00654]MCX4967115.1 hypothetical protein [Streptomyces sp. NBC_00654]